MLEDELGTGDVAGRAKEGGYLCANFWPGPRCMNRDVLFGISGKLERAGGRGTLGRGHMPHAAGHCSESVRVCAGCAREEPAERMGSSSRPGSGPLSLLLPLLARPTLPSTGSRAELA